MKKLRLLPILALTAALVLPGGAAFAQDESADPSPAAEETADDARLTELEALVPPALAGLPLDENLQLATGEELATVMSPEEAAVLGDMLEANGATIEDYAAATTWLPITDTDVVVLQAHRVTGVDASQTVDAWVEILSMGMTEPQAKEGFIAGRAVTLVSDAAQPEVPLVHLYPIFDVMWMIVAADQALVEEAVNTVTPEDETSEEATETEADA